MTMMQTGRTADAAGSGLQAVAVVALLAAAAAMAVVGIGHVASLQPERPVDVGGVPTELADGSAPVDVPPALADAVGLPVIGAVVRDEPPDCRGGDATTLITADGIYGISAGGHAFSCGDQGASFGGGFASSSGGATDGETSSAECCDAEGYGTASATIRVPPGATWMLQNRLDYYLAIPVDAKLATLAWRFRSTASDGRHATSVVFVDDDGTILGERVLGQ